MDNSQSSDCFPESFETSYMSPLPMETLPYETLVANTKVALSCNSNLLQKSTVFTYCTSVINDCFTSISQSLELITGMLTEATEICLNKLTEYLNDAIFLLQSLSDFIKNVTEAVSMTCHSMNTFATTTGHIILTVFSHCKDSEDLYGRNLSNVEKQLKDLFRNCHELQLTYLMALEKHFIFDLTEKHEKDILIEVFHINLKIGEIVHSLDVKTMAEQWKAYTSLCEKYSTDILESNIFRDCTQILCTLIRNNIKTAVENNQDDKIVTRSLKVTSFTIKILMKICTTFKNAKSKDCGNVLNIILYMQTLRYSPLGLAAEMCRFKNLINVNIVIPSECLLKELLSDHTFCTCLLTWDEDTVKNNEDLLASILTLTSVMKIVTQGCNNSVVTKINLINCVYRSLPFCYKWLNKDFALNLDIDQIVSHGLFEHLLIHTAAMVFTMTNEEFGALEKHMISAILGTDCVSALFSGNLWMLIARHVSPQLLFNQLLWLCTMYKKLENHKMFYRSPQKIHLSFTISMLFSVISVEDKIKICKQFRIHDDNNVCLWTALGVCNLPDEVKFAAEDVVADKLKMHLQWLNEKQTEGVPKLVQVINLAAICTFTNSKGIEDCVMKAWSKTCPKHNFAIQYLDGSTVWFYDYLEAIVSLTNSIWRRLCERKSNLSQLLHWVTNLIRQCDTEFRLILIKVLCKITSQNCEKFPDLTEAFTCLIHSEDIVQKELFRVLIIHRNDKNLDRILSNIEDSKLQETWSDIKGGNYIDSTDIISTDFKYKHKCYEQIKIQTDSSSVKIKKESSGNFDIADMDFFETDSDSEPLCKKVKLNANETDTILKRLENDASLLCQVKENVITSEYKSRIRNVCEQLRSVIN